MAQNRDNKRHWKNYLLDSSYQLRFTFTLLAVAGGLLFPMGWWVSVQANYATDVALTRIDGITCPESLRSVSEPSLKSAPGVEEPMEVTSQGDNTKATITDSTGKKNQIHTRATDVEHDHNHPNRKSSTQKKPRAEISVAVYEDEWKPADPMHAPDQTAPEVIATSKKIENSCLAMIDTQRKIVIDRQSLITLILVISSTLLFLGLGIYGITSTHKVAGPLFKISGYLRKVEDNHYDEIYGLRKSDHLREFYNRFRTAHAEISEMQQTDRDRLRDAISLAEESSLGASSPEMKTIIKELERLLDQKEESLCSE